MLGVIFTIDRRVKLIEIVKGSRHKTERRQSTKKDSLS